MQLIKSSTQRRIDHWVAFAFCVFLSLMALSGSVSDRSAGWWSPAFFSFLPICFFYMGAVTARMQREINELQSRLEVLQFHSSASSTGLESHHPAADV